MADKMKDISQEKYNELNAKLTQISKHIAQIHAQTKAQMDQW